jgi:hypothetical protein
MERDDERSDVGERLVHAAITVSSIPKHLSSSSEEEHLLVRDEDAIVSALAMRLYFPPPDPNLHYWIQEFCPA